MQPSVQWKEIAAFTQFLFSPNVAWKELSGTNVFAPKQARINQFCLFM